MGLFRPQDTGVPDPSRAAGGEPEGAHPVLPHLLGLDQADRAGTGQRGVQPEDRHVPAAGFLRRHPVLDARGHAGVARPGSGQQWQVDVEPGGGRGLLILRCAKRGGHHMRARQSELGGDQEPQTHGISPYVADPQHRRVQGLRADALRCLRP
ncbi:hypothetical protein STANM309S_03688 [Streptomyces tanashiensis]